MADHDPLRVQLSFAFVLGAMEGVLIRKGERSLSDLIHTVRTVPDAPTDLHSNRIFKIAIIAGAARGFLRGR